MRWLIVMSRELNMEDFRGKEFSEEEWWKIWEEDSDFRISGACSVLDDLFTEMWNEGWFANIQEGTNTCYEFLGRHKKEPLPEKVEGASYNMGVDDLENADELIERYDEGSMCTVSYWLEGSDEVVDAFVGDAHRYACEWYDRAEEQHMMDTLKKYEIRVISENNPDLYRWWD